jgi:hypothetical protein
MSALGTGLCGVSKGTLIAFRSASSAFTTRAAKKRDHTVAAVDVFSPTLAAALLNRNAPVALPCLIYYVELILLLHKL